MPHIAIIAASVRTGRKSDRAAHYFYNYLQENNLATAEILDLAEYNFPVFEERLRLQKNPSAGALEFAEKIKAADGVLIVTPEYNGGYPAAIKNVVDLLYEEWHRKPVGIITASDGMFGGTQVLISLQFSLWKMRAWTIPAMFPIPKVQETFDESGHPTDKVATDKRAAAYLKELLWCVEANVRMAQ